MEKLFLILNGSSEIMGTFETDAPEDILSNMTPVGGSIVSIQKPNDEFLERINGSIFDVSNSTEVVESSITDCVHYSPESINYRPDGSPFWIYQNDAWVDSRALDDLKDQAKVDIDNHAGTIRSKYITVAPGQEMTYMEKSEEAADFVTAGYPADTSNYPFIQAEMDATGLTKEQAADGILAQKSAWIVVGATIEKTRLSGKAQVDAAVDQDGVNTAVTNTKALLDAI